MARLYDEYLVRAERCVIVGELCVTRQWILIERLAAKGLDTTEAEKVLEVFMQRLAYMYKYLQHLRDEQSKLVALNSSTSLLSNKD